MEETSSESMYLEHILDLYKHPLNFGTLKNPTHKAEKYNPLCGDKVKINLLIEKDIIKDIKFSGSGCAISMAATSLLTEKIKNKDKNYIQNLKKEDILELIEIPISYARLKCVLISLEAIKEAIKTNKTHNTKD